MRTSGDGGSTMRISRERRTGTGCLVVSVLSVVSVAAQAAAWRGVERLPGHEPVIVKVEEKARTYFRVTPRKPLEVVVRGPAKLRVVSRAEMPAASERQVSYRLRVSEGKKVVERQSAETIPSTQARIKTGARSLGQSRQVIVKVPGDGLHTLRVSVEGLPSVLVRLLTAEAASRSERTVSLTPVEASRSVLFKEGERVIPYYSVLPGKPVRFRVVGPTRLDLISRLDFDSTMLGRQSYRLAISDGRRRREVEFKTTKALTAAYEDLKDRVPSKFRRLEMPVDEGLHVISVDLVKPARGSVEIQARIPEPSVGNEE
jgi:hypothetical protein